MNAEMERKVQTIWDLTEEGTDSEEIARNVGLSRMQVVSIQGHRRLELEALARAIDRRVTVGPERIRALRERFARQKHKGEKLMRKKILLAAVLVLLAVPGFGVSQCETKLHACSNRCETTTTTDQQYDACLDRCDAAYDACASYAPPNDCPVYVCPPYG